MFYLPILKLYHDKFQSRAPQNNLLWNSDDFELKLLKEEPVK